MNNQKIKNFESIINDIESNIKEPANLSDNTVNRIKAVIKSIRKSIDLIKKRNSLNESLTLTSEIIQSNDTNKNNQKINDLTNEIDTLKSSISTLEEKNKKISDENLIIKKENSELINSENNKLLAKNIELQLNLAEKIKSEKKKIKKEEIRKRLKENRKIQENKIKEQIDESNKSIAVKNMAKNMAEKTVNNSINKAVVKLTEQERKNKIKELLEQGMRIINEKCEPDEGSDNIKENQCDGEDGKLYYEIFKGVLFSNDVNANNDKDVNANNIANAIKNKNVEDSSGKLNSEAIINIINTLIDSEKLNKILKSIGDDNDDIFIDDDDVSGLKLQSNWKNNLVKNKKHIINLRESLNKIKSDIDAIKTADDNDINDNDINDNYTHIDSSIDALDKIVKAINEIVLKTYNEEAERQKKEAERKAQQEAEEAERKAQQEAEEAERRKKEAEEAARKKREEEAARKKKEAEEIARQKEAERQKKEAEEAERQKKEAEEIARKKREEERKKREAKEAAKRKITELIQRAKKIINDTCEDKIDKTTDSNEHECDNEDKKLYYQIFKNVFSSSIGDISYKGLKAREFIPTIISNIDKGKDEEDNIAKNIETILLSVFGTKDYSIEDDQASKQKYDSNISDIQNKLDELIKIKHEINELNASADIDIESSIETLQEVVSADPWKAYFQKKLMKNKKIYIPKLFTNSCDNVGDNKSCTTSNILETIIKTTQNPKNITGGGNPGKPGNSGKKKQKQKQKKKKPRTRIKRKINIPPPPPSPLKGFQLLTHPKLSSTIVNTFNDFTNTNDDKNYIQNLEDWMGNKIIDPETSQGIIANKLTYVKELWKDGAKPAVFIAALGNSGTGKTYTLFGDKQIPQSKKNALIHKILQNVLNGEKEITVTLDFFEFSAFHKTPKEKKHKDNNDLIIKFNNKNNNTFEENFNEIISKIDTVNDERLTYDTTPYADEWDKNVEEGEKVLRGEIRRDLNNYLQSKLEGGKAGGEKNKNRKLGGVLITDIMKGNKGNKKSSRTELVIKITIKKEEKEMYIYLIDPAGKEYIMYQNNQEPRVNLSAKYKNFNNENNIIKNIENKNKEDVDINYLLMAIESHFINISLFYLKYIFLNKNNIDIVSLFEKKKKYRQDFINTFENDTHFVYKIGEISKQSYFTGVTSIKYNNYTSKKYSETDLNWDINILNKKGNIKKFTTNFEVRKLSPDFLNSILKYFKSAPYQRDGGEYKDTGEQPLHFIHWLQNEIALHGSHFFISLHTIDSRIKKTKNTITDASKNEIKDKIDTELKDIIKFIDHDMVYPKQKVENVSIPQNTTDNREMHDVRKGQTSDGRHEFGITNKHQGKEGSFGPRPQRKKVRRRGIGGGRLTLKKKHLFNNKKRKTLKKKHMFN